jgi:hypothetical protein
MIILLALATYQKHWAELPVEIEKQQLQQSGSVGGVGCLGGRAFVIAICKQWDSEWQHFFFGRFATAVPDAIITAGVDMDKR